jgi:hypothetical protein
MSRDWEQSVQAFKPKHQNQRYLTAGAVFFKSTHPYKSPTVYSKFCNSMRAKQELRIHRPSDNYSQGLQMILADLHEVPAFLGMGFFAFLNCSKFRYHFPDWKNNKDSAPSKSPMVATRTYIMTCTTEGRKFDDIGREKFGQASTVAIFRKSYMFLCLPRSSFGWQLLVSKYLFNNVSS